jgi:hypothetical protein
MRRIFPPKPPDLVDLLFNLQTFQVIELRFVALKSAIHVVLSASRIGRLGLKGQRAYLKCCTYHSGLEAILTPGSLWKITTRPPLSPVARRSPSSLNSTQEMMSAVKVAMKTNA